MSFTKGSEWRKWDLHVHTPLSIDQHYGGDTDEAWEKYISDLEDLPEEFSVLGINDYIFLDGYKKVLEYKNKGRLNNIDTILPVIELRVDKFGNVGDKAWKKINLHIIFSNEINAETIESQFLNAIQVGYQLTPIDDNIDNINFNGVITKESLTDLGQKIKDSSSIEITDSCLKVGFRNFTHSYEKVKEVLESSHYFKDKYLKAVGKTEWDSMRWDGSISDKKTMINEADFVFISTDNTENYQKALEKLKNEGVNSNLLDCSDSHSYSNKIEEKDRIGNSMTWIKANPTFKGLQQAKMDFNERIFIGNKPEVLIRVRDNRTKYIKSLHIDKIEGYSYTKGKWFGNIDIELNSELTAIIGNKGSGKSAISDIIALLGNSHKEKHFSFLHANKFRKGKLSENFQAELTFQSGENFKDTLDNNIKVSEVERVRYLPQNYFEELCNDLEGEGFEKALKNVVFSHLEDADRLGTNSFDELVSLKINSIEKDIEIIIPKIDDINREIIALEEKKHQSYKATIISKLKLKYKELLNHIKNKPEKIYKPNNSSEPDEKYKKLIEEISVLKKTLNEKEELLRAKKQEKQIRLLSITELKELLSDISRITKSIEDFKSEKEDIFNKHHLKINDLVKFSSDLKQLETLIDNHKKSILEIDKMIFDEENSTGLEIDISTINSSITTMEKELSEPEQNYRKYLAVFSEWKEHVKKLIGTKTEYDTIKFYMAEKKYLKNDLINDIANKREERINLSLQIYDKKFEVVSVFKQLKETIDNAISRYDELLANYDITIEATFKLEGFEKDFLSHIQQNKMGSFYGTDEGRIKLRELLEEKDFDDREVFKDILNSFILYLEKDFREDERYKDKDREIAEQVKDVYKLYDYIFNLSYLVPNYELKLDNKGLVELSPGEKGALLLVFFLMLDKEEIPLIIDQPEDNLDNQSVYRLIVQFIKNAKKRRQIIMVTHNPNLAVVADAEQIIYTEIDKQDKNKFSIKSGAIEDETINKCILDILEGTRPAFETRRKKYF